MDSLYRPKLFYLTLFTVLTTFILITWGGYVKSFEAGLAFPDWPTSDGYFMWFFPIDQMEGAKFWEHSHRLIGSFVGILMIVLTFWHWKTESRKAVKNLMNTAMILVIVQGCLGGLTVHLALEEKIVSIAHAGLAQVFLAFVIALAIVNSKTWLNKGSDFQLRSTVFALLPFLLLGQTLLGACYRHWNDNLSWFVWHLLGAVVVIVLISWACIAILTEKNKPQNLTNAVILLLVSLLIQLVLGGSAFYLNYTDTTPEVISFFEASIATAHVTVGAFLMAISIYLYLHTHQPIKLKAT